MINEFFLLSHIGPYNSSPYNTRCQKLKDKAVISMIPFRKNVSLVKVSLTTNLDFTEGMVKTILDLSI